MQEKVKPGREEQGPLGAGVVFPVASSLVMPSSEKRDGVEQTEHLQPPLPTH